MALSCIKLATALLVLVVVAAGFLTVRLNQGPIAIDGLGQKIASALHDRFGKDLQFAVGDTSLMQRGFGPALRIEKLSVKGPDGQSILEAPHAEVSVDPFALIFGKVAPKRLEVFDVTLRLLLQKNGNLAIAAENGSQTFVEIGGGSADPPAKQSSGAAPPTPAQDTPVDQEPRTHRAIAMKKAAEAIRQFIDILTDPKSPVAAVDRLGVSRGTLIIEDEDTDESTTYKGLDLGFDQAHGTSTFNLSAEGPNGRWRVTATADGRPGLDRHFSLKAADLSIDELKLAAGSRSLAVDTDAPFGAHLDISLKPDNALGEVSGGIDLGHGFVRFDDPDMEPLLLTSLESAFHWDPAHRQIAIDSIHYVENDTHFTIAGQVEPPLNEGEPWRIAMSLKEPGLLGIDRKGQEPIPIEQGQFIGRLMPNEKMFVIDRFAFKAKEGGIALAGEADWSKGRHIRIGASIDPTPVRVVQRVWPNLMASAVRAWIINHFESGMVTAGTLKIDYDDNALKRMRADRSPPDGAVAIDFKISKGRVSYLDGVPPLENVEGSGRITGRTTHFVINSGTTRADGRTIQLSDTTFTVPNANQHPTPAVLSAHLSGQVEAVTNILSRDALRPYASVPLDPSTLHGNVEGTLEKSLMLGKGADHSHDALNVNAQISNFVAERLIGKENLEDASLSIVVGSGALKATGQGQLFGGPVAFEIDRVGTEPPIATMNITLDDDARAKLGLNAVSGVSGPIAAHVRATLGDPSKMKAQVDLDLAKASIAAAYLGLTKPTGRPGKVSFSLASVDDRMQIDPIAFDIGSLQGRGAVELAPDNSFKSAHLSAFKVSPGDDMKVDVVKGDSSFKLTIRGTTIDARPFLKALTSTPKDDSSAMSRSARAEKKEADSFKGFDIDLKSGLLTGFNKEVMTNVDLKLSKRSSQIKQFAVQGRFGRAAVSGSMGGNQKIRVTSGNAGALVSFVDLYKHMEGGNLNAGMVVGEDTLDGNLEIRDFVLRDEPAIRRLVATSATVSAPGQDTDAARRIDAGAVAFKRLKVNFARAGSRLQLSDATMYGSEIGLSVDGWLDYTHDRVAMKGTFVPAYAVNNLFSQIPLFGVFLGGKSNEGLFAITFNISGQASSPTLGINPLSSIAPGFLRQIFGVLDTPGQSAPDASR